MKKIIAAVCALAILCSLFTITAAAAVNMDLSESEMTDGTLRIEEAGSYTLTGEMEGTLTVDPGEGDVTIILDGADINGGTEPAIVALSGDSLRVIIADGSTNRVIGSDSSSEYGGAVFTTVDTSFEGSGLLYIASSGQNGICSSNANLVFENGEYTMGVAKYGIATEGAKAGSLTVNGGTFRIEAQAAIDPSTRYFINGGTFIDLTESTEASAYESCSETASSSASEDSAADTADKTTVSDESTAAAETAETQQTGEAETSAATQAEARTQHENGEPDPNETRPEQPEEGTQQAMPSDVGQGNDKGQPAASAQGSNSFVYESADSPAEIVTGTVTNSAADLSADLDNATYLTITDEDSAITISSSGTYVITGTCRDGNITVKKGTTGVVLILEDLDLTSTTGATVSVNKNAEVQIVISGTVVLTDNENPEDETSEDEAVSDAYDGAALKVKDNSNVYVTGDGTLVINGNAKNGIKAGDDSSIVFDGVTVNISAANDGINSNYDVALLSGSFTIAAGDDAIHADHIVTIGSEDGSGPVINVTECCEGIEGTVVNIYGGGISIRAEDDAINAANSDGTYEGELDYAINVLGGKIILNCDGDGLDSNGNINLIGGSASIDSASDGGEAGIDYDGQFYLSDSFELNNNSGVAGPDGQQGDMGQANPNEQQGGMGQANPDGQQGDMGQTNPNGQQGGMGQTDPGGAQNGMGQAAPNGVQGGIAGAAA